MIITADKLLNAVTALHQIVARYDEICDSSIRHTLKADGFYTRQQVEQHLASLEQQNRNLKIGIIGRVKAGKSSLINALLFDGKDILPKAATPMTAALTSIGYSGKFVAHVDFFSSVDILQLKAKAEEFEREVERTYLADKQQLQQRQGSMDRPAPPGQDETLRKHAKKKVSENPVLASAADLYQRIKVSNIDVSSLGENRVLETQSTEELARQLMDYVGSAGRYMPFTRELRIGMPLESLKGIDILDTPGINDPVKSREQRTYDRLKECNVAFLVSPAGQFISEQDFELADRLSSKDGAQEIYIVASQADTQLHSSINHDAKGILPDAVELLRQTLASQAASALSKCNNTALQQIANQQHHRLIITAGICESLLLSGGSSDDENIQFTMGRLRKTYPDYFSNPENTRANLTLLSGRKALEQAIEAVRLQKAKILAEQANNFIAAQWQTLITVKSQIEEKLAQRRTEVEATDKAELDKKLVALKVAAQKGETAANSEFINQLEELQLTLPRALRKALQKAIEFVDEKSEGAKGSDRESYTVEKGGAISWLARKTGFGGYETRYETIQTLEPLPVRKSLEGFSRLLRNGLQDCTTETMLQWRRSLVTCLSSQLRDAIGDEYVEINQLEHVCRKVVADVIAIPSVQIPELPASLVKTTKLKGSSAGNYIEEALTYGTALEQCGEAFISNVKKVLQVAEKQQVGSVLIANLLEEMQKLQLMIESKAVTLKKMDLMKAELMEI